MATIPYLNSVNYRRGDVLGYTSIALSALLVFLGVRSYRENSSGGRLSFGRGLAVGLLITLISSACHVITFQVLYFKVFPNLGDKYTACMIQRAKDSGASDQKIRQTAELAERLKRLCDKPATNAAVAFAEDRKSTRLNSSHGYISYAVFCLKKKTDTKLHDSHR